MMMKMIFCVPVQDSSEAKEMDAATIFRGLSIKKYELLLTGCMRIRATLLQKTLDMQFYRLSEQAFLHRRVIL